MSFGKTGDALTRYEKDSLAYWITYWTQTYEYLLDARPNNGIFLCYERLTENPGATLRKLFEKLSLPTAHLSTIESMFKPAMIYNVECDNMMAEKANSVYENIVNSEVCL